MSHFFLIVRLPADTSSDALTPRLEEALAPYDWNLKVTFKDEEDEHRARWGSESVEHVVMPDGRKLLTWDRAAEAALRKVGQLPKIQIPKREMFPSFDDYMAEWCEIERGGPNNRYGYMINPHSQWDWWEVGGRWAGKLDGENCKRINEVDFAALTPCPFALLDPAKGVPGGWSNAPGWGTGDEEKGAWRAKVLEWAKGGDQNDWVVVVDCHT